MPDKPDTNDELIILSGLIGSLDGMILRHQDNWKAKLALTRALEQAVIAQQELLPFAQRPPEKCPVCGRPMEEGVHSWLK